ncbi:poly(A) polymerase gamma [Hamiltosporidium tvaerminnensis]|uniref:polynucleotide adenylyltransferase n=1 Tax=Hamiltosporidium tvaerminnensis TaxID=1176355 RepID=A0A4Q9KWB9_9MICR|nr:poly(A) polymerase gamma [Hamiltosporidium tvaerminnensis]
MQHNTPTTPLSLKKPSPLDIKLSKSLSHHLNTTYYTKPPHLQHTHEKVLSLLHILTLKYTKHIATQKNLPPRNYTSLIYTFGSYRLGVNSQYSDIDTLVLFPRFITRTDFFTTFVDYLRCNGNISSRDYKELDNNISSSRDYKELDSSKGNNNISSEGNINSNNNNNISSSKGKDYISSSNTNKEINTNINTHNTNTNINTNKEINNTNNNKEINTNNNNILVIAVVEHAYVPLIKLRISNINIDLVFCRLNTMFIDKGLCLLNNNILKGMDEKCILSVNGSRVTDIILEGVNNKENFRVCLKGVKLWAKRKGLYGNVYGYMGGVSYAICVAKICLLYPNGNAFYLLKKFFKIFSEWKWPVPVIIREYEECGLNLKVWDPKSCPGDRFHKMPVITPAYPYMCSTHNVSSSTLGVIVEEMKKASNIIDEYVRGVSEIGGGDSEIGGGDSEIGGGDKGGGVSEILGGDKGGGVSDKSMAWGVSDKGGGVNIGTCGVPGLNIGTNTLHPLNISNNTLRPVNTNNNKQHPLNKDEVTLWSKLFAPSDFFTRYRFYMTVICNSMDIEVWEGYVESKIRVLCQRMEVLEEFGGVIPYPKVFRVKWCNKVENVKNIEGVKGEGSEGGVRDSRGKLEGVNNSIGKLEGVNNSSNKQQGLSNLSNKQQGLNNSSSKQQGLNNSTNKQQGLNNNSSKQQGLNNSTNNLHPLNNSNNKQQDLSNNLSNNLHPLSNSNNKLNKNFEKLFNKNICGLECSCRKDYPLFVSSVNEDVSVFFIGLQLNEFRVPGKRIFVDKQVKEFIEYLKENGKECGDGGVSVKVVKRSEVGVFMRAYTKERGVSNSKGSEGGVSNRGRDVGGVNISRGIDEGVSNSTNEQQGISNRDMEQHPVITSTKEQQGVSNRDMEQHPVSNSTNEQQGVSNRDMEQHPVITSTNEQKGLTTSTNKQKGVITSTNKQQGISNKDMEQHPVITSTNEQQGISNKDMEQHPVITSTNEQQGISNRDMEQHPVITSSNKQKGLTTSNNEQHPVITSTNKQQGVNMLRNINKDLNENKRIKK